jgi:hypothetical protein
MAVCNFPVDSYAANVATMLFSHLCGNESLIFRRPVSSGV